MKYKKKYLLGFSIFLIIMNSCMNTKQEVIMRIGTKEAFFTYIAGDVTINRGGKENEASLDSILMENDLIETASNSTCDIQFGKSAYIRVEEDTIFKLEQLSVIPNNTQNTLNIKMGSLLCKVKKLLAKEDFSIVTDSTVVSVRGTTFGVRISESSDISVFVNTGQVLLLPQAMNISLILTHLPDVPSIKEKIQKIIEGHAIYLNPLEETTITVQEATAAAAVFSEAQKILDTVTESNITTIEELIDRIASEAMTGLPIPHAITEPNNSALDLITEITMKNVFIKGIPKQIAVFKDINLEVAVREIIKKKIGNIYVSDLKMIKKLDIKGKLITVLDGIENLENLSFLNVAGNPIKDFSILEKLEKLEVLIICDYDPKGDKRYINEVIDLSTLSNLTNLKVLRLGYFDDKNKLKKYNLNAIANLKKLTSLAILGMNTEDITPLSQLINLKNLVLENNNIKDITPLTNLTNLLELSIGWNNISDISPLSNLKNLRMLVINTNKISDISVLSNFQYLGDISYLEKNLDDEIELAWLKTVDSFLWMQDNNINDLTPLLTNYNNGGLRNLKKIYIPKNNLDLTPGTTNRNVVDTLINAGIDVVYKGGNKIE